MLLGFALLKLCFVNRYTEFPVFVLFCLLMSLEYRVFVQSVDDTIVPRWLEDLNALNMRCDIHPEFSFTDQAGLLPFKLNIQSGTRPELLNQDFVSGFEFDMEDFDIDAQIAALSEPGLMDRLLGRNTRRDYFMSPEIDERLRPMKKMMIFNWCFDDIFEYRLARLSSITLSRLCGGLCYSREDECFFEGDDAVTIALAEVEQFETLLKEKAVKTHRFEAWL